MKLEYNQRLCLVGFTGSGKTELVRHILAHPVLNRILVIDPKHTFKADGFRIKNRLPLNNQFKIIFRPDPGNEDKLILLLHECFRRGRILVYVDELSTLADFFPGATERLTDLVRTGREKGVGVWCSMQRPRNTPRVFLSESEAFIIFGLRLQEDRDYIGGFVGNEIFNFRLPRFGFWFVRDDLPPEALTLALGESKLKRVKPIEGGF